MHSAFPWAFLIPVSAILGAFATAIVAMLLKARVREAEIRERIAMIERGLVPPPEVDPRGFDRAMSRYERRDGRSSAGRHRRAGITLIGVGFGLMVLIGFAGDSPSTAVGVGGFLVVIGIAFYINSLFEERQEPFGTTPAATTPSAARPLTTDSTPAPGTEEPPLRRD